MTRAGTYQKNSSKELVLMVLYVQGVGNEKKFDRVYSALKAKEGYFPVNQYSPCSHIRSVIG